MLARAPGPARILIGVHLVLEMCDKACGCGSSQCPAGAAFPPRSLSAMTACSAVESLQRTLRRAGACPAPRLAGGARTRVHAAGLMRYVNRVRTATACFRRQSCRIFGRCGRLGCAARPQRMRCTRARNGAPRLAVGGPCRPSPCSACKIFVRLPACIILPRATARRHLGRHRPAKRPSCELVAGRCA